MSKEDPTPPRNLHTPQNPPPQPAHEDSTSEEEDAPDIWSDELFPLNILPFSDSDTNNSDPEYTTSENSSPSGSDDTEGEDNEDEEDPDNNEEEDNAEEEADDEEEDNEEEEADDPEDNMANPNPPPPQISGGQLNSVTPFSGNQGLDGLVYVKAIDRAMEQFGWTQVQTARAAVTRGGNIVANWIRGE